MRIRILLPFLGLLPLAPKATAQVTVTPGLGPTELAVGIFQGAGVTISNAVLVGLPDTTSMAAGGFSASGTSLLPAQGLALSSGYVTSIPFPAFEQNSSDDPATTAEDPDLAELIGGQVTNACILEFDFVPENDLLLFDYVFGSEEYPEFVCNYNDAFGFFLSGPGISGPFTNGAVNLAVLPGTNVPVTINTVNNGLSNHPDDPACPAQHPEYYVDNSEGPFIVYDGLTTLLSTEALLTPGMTYHIKLAIGDAGNGFYDTAYDSGLFFTAHSFRSVPSIPLGLGDAPSSRSSARMEGDALLVQAASAIGPYLLSDALGRAVRQGSAPGASTSIDTQGIPAGPLFLRTQHGVVRVMKP